MKQPVWWTLMIRELRLLARDLHGLAVLFLMPIVFILIMSMALQRTFDQGAGLVVAVEDQAQTSISKDFLQRLAQLPALSLQEQAAPDARLLIPSDFERRLSHNDKQRPPIVDVQVAARVPAEVRSLFVASVQQALGALLIEASLGISGDDIVIGELPVGMGVVNASGDNIQIPTSTQQNVPAWLVFGMFFAVLPLSGTVIRDRDRGLLARFRVIGVGAQPLLLSRLGAYGVVNLLQAMAMLAVGFWLIPVFGGEGLSMQGKPLALLALVFATSSAAVGFSLWVAMVSRTQLQAIATGGAATILLAVLGGVMVPVFVMPPAMQAISQISPMNWAVTGLVGTMTGTVGFAEVATAAVALTCFGGVSLWLASRSFVRVDA